MASNFKLQAAFQYQPSDMVYVPVTAGQTFIDGNIVNLTSFAAVVGTSTSTSTVLGQALGSAADGLATGGSIWGGTNIPVLLFRPGQKWFIASTTTPVFGTHFGVAYGVTISATANVLLDISNTTQTLFRVMGVSNSPQQEGFFVTPTMPGYLLFSGIAS